MTDDNEINPSSGEPLLCRENIFVSVTKGMKVTAGDVAIYELGVEIQDFAALSGMRGCKDENIEFWNEFLSIYRPNLTFHAPFVDLHPGSEDPDERQYATRRISDAILLASDFGASLVVMHSGWPPPAAKKYGNWDNWDFITEHIIEMSRIAESAGIVLAVENVYEDNPDVLKYIAESIKSDNLKLCLDTGHANVKSKVSLDEWVRTYGDRLAYIHLHDNNGKKDRHLAVGQGKIDFAPFFRELRKSEYSGGICIESWPLRWDQSISRLKEENIF
jgi:sugar phosphate isomerase/epimerase